MENSIEDKIEEKYTRYINCETDILELTIEEAIFILEKDASLHYVDDLLQEAYKVILSDYKRVLKENEELIETYKSEKKMKNEYVKLYQVLLLKENVIPVQKVKDKIEELDKKEQELQNSISVEEREEYSDANISWKLMDINIRRETLQKLLEEGE